MKQYVTKEAYTDNTTIYQFVDGTLVSYGIYSDYEVPGYLRCLEDKGYKHAYFVDAYLQKVKEAEEALKEAKEMYEVAKKAPLIISTKEKSQLFEDLFNEI